MDIAEQNQNTGIRHFFDVVRRRKWVLIQVVVLVPLLAVFLSLRQQKLYEATADVLVGQQNLAAGIVGAPSFYTDDRLLQTQAEVARSPIVIRNTVRAARDSRLSPGAFLGASRVAPKPNVNILQFSVTDESQERAARLANTYARQYMQRQLTLEALALQEARAEVTKQLGALRKARRSRSPEYLALLDRQEQLKTAQALRNNLTIIHPAGGAVRIQPRPLRNGVLGGILGLVLGLGLIFLWEALDTRIRHADEVTRRLGLPLLARVPKNSKRRAIERPVMLEDPGGPHSEPYRMLRTNLEFVTLEHGVRVLMITSALGQEGKTTTASNLAVSLARAGRRVTLVDLDLRRPSVARVFGLEKSRGLTDTALGRLSLEEALIPVSMPAIDGVAAWSNGDGSPSANGRATIAGSLRVLTSGALPPDPGEFAGSRAVADIISRLRDTSDLVIIDTPPLLHVGDAMALSAKVDALVTVVRLDTLRSPTLNELRRVLDACPARKLGYVLTGVEAVEDYYGYAGYYERRSSAAEERQEQGTPA